MITSTTVMREILHSIADGDCSRIPILLGILKTRNRLGRGVLCVFVGRTFVTISWMRKKPISVSHSSTESEIISLDAGLRIDGIPALTLWDLVIEVFHSVPNNTDGPKRESHGENRRQATKPNMHNTV